MPSPALVTVAGNSGSGAAAVGPPVGMDSLSKVVLDGDGGMPAGVVTIGASAGLSVGSLLFSVAATSASASAFACSGVRNTYPPRLVHGRYVALYIG